MTDFKSSLNEECGIFGVYNYTQAAELTLHGLHQLQHRGHDGAGIVTYSKKNLLNHRGVGLVSTVFNKGIEENLFGDIAIGHVRYATAGKSEIKNVQPFISQPKKQEAPFAYAHNGHIVNSDTLKTELRNKGIEFQTDSDSEILEHLIYEGKHELFEDNLKSALSRIKGAFVYVVLKERQLFIARDPNGFRPVSIARLKDSYIVSSETCTFDMIGATFIHELEPGELVKIDDSGIKKEFYTKNTNLSICSMEFIYFSRPESTIGGVNIYNARKRMGEYLSKQDSVNADIVIGVPDSGIPAAIGFSKESKIPFEQAIIKNKYVGRTFIQSSQELRESSVSSKFSVIKEVVRGKKIIIVDDSIVRGTTIKWLIYLLKHAGAKEVHVRIASPPFKYPCFFGIDIPSTDELIASKMNIEEVCSVIGADSLIYLNIENLIKSINLPKTTLTNNGLCIAYFTGNYPIDLCDCAINL
ncbi:amidophosphoribosyltransferase [Enterococcus rivorum]|uniref:Amidophosphoribosyltransferase n=1 Tax=Enterococcus rivorum TaxID=762845 RepID=A0A1E5KWA5_9ENTE|nr:amidophosphoribosyltransferase [Enterococcus rivorum]MBP2100487.1 amidophosphoribosyltransferase [Enterococcus rivorum]OEH82154.1 amidophosphoribosyltransferase [Enterococcus rivorum]